MISKDCGAVLSSQFAIAVSTVLALGGCSAFKPVEFAQSNSPSGQAAAGAKLYETHCAACHGPLGTTNKRGRSAEQIKAALTKDCDPAGTTSLASLTASEIGLIAQSLGGGGETCSQQTDPGRVPLHRLNRDEYSQTVRTLLGISGTPGQNLPEENTAFGFKNIASILSVTSVSIDRYLEAAELAVESAFTQNAAGLFICNGSSVNPDSLSRACAEQILMRLAQSAFRRPLVSTEQTQVAGFLDSAAAEGLSLKKGLRLGLEWMLLTPSFLFRVIQHPSPNDPQTVKPLSGHELASRLSFFLWSNQPDQELLARAADGSLNQSTVLQTQVARMLKDPKAQALVDGFARQWLQLHRFEMQSIDTSVYAFSEDLRKDMMTETNMLLRDALFNGKGLLSLVDSQTSYLNSRLAEHYGVSGPASATEFVRVDLSATERRGLLGQGSILTLTSLPNRTSVVRRGKWVLDNILCEPPPPPPPNIPDGLPGDPGGSLKDKMEQHRKNPVCASCHKVIDPVGFTLENFDANGTWRTKYRDGSAIDSQGGVGDGKPVTGPLDLATVLKADPRYRKCVTQKLMTYALGRGLETKDQCTVNRLAQDHVGQGQTFEELVKALVTSDPFRKQSGDGGQ